MATTQHHDAAAAVPELHCRRVGAGPDLVMLHGWGLHAGIWEPVIEALSGCFRLHLYDLPGHGRSAPAEGFGLEVLRAALLRSVPERAHWLGWSLGGLAALDFAAHHPDRVSRLALVACNAQFVATADWPQAMTPEVLEDFALALETDHAATLKRFLGLVARGAPGSGVLRALRSAMQAAPPPTAGALCSGLEILRATDLRAQARALPMPVLWLAGARDTLVPVAALRVLAGANPQQRLFEIAQAGHAPFISHPDAFIAAVTEFFACTTKPAC
ncbi:MAG: pimeloyl-ACP methyl ester esterase BioH [Gammaproteobacteria bacterium]